MTQFQKPSFSVSLGNANFSKGWDAIFGPKSAKRPVKVGDMLTEKDPEWRYTKLFVDGRAVIGIQTDGVRFASDFWPEGVLYGWDELVHFDETEIDVEASLAGVAAEIQVPAINEAVEVSDVQAPNAEIALPDNDYTRGYQEGHEDGVMTGRNQDHYQQGYQAGWQAGTSYADEKPEPAVELEGLQRRSKEWADHNFPLRATPEHDRIATEFLERYFYGLQSDPVREDLAKLLAARDHRSYRPLLGACEELGELSHAHLKNEQGIRGTPEEWAAKKKDAIGDVVIYLLDYCNKEAISMQECVETAWAEVSARDWVRFPGDGVSK